MVKRLFFSFLTAALLILFASSALQTKEDVNKSRYVKNHVIVKLKKQFTGAAGEIPGTFYVQRIKEISSILGLNADKVKRLFPPTNQNAALCDKYEVETYYVLTTSDQRDIPSVCSDFEKSKFVDFAEPDFIGEAAGVSSDRLGLKKPNDEFFSRQWGLYNDGSVKTTTGLNGKPGADMNVLRAWETEQGSENTIIAILDSGVKLDHPELSGRIWVNPKESKNGRDDDGNGFVDDINGWNFAYDNSNVKDDGGHGSNIAGTIGANTDNSIGYAGIDRHCKLMVCKDLDEENLGEYSWWAAALYYAANNGARAINMSEGGYDYSKTLANAVNFAYDAGCLIMASMMNKNNGDNYYPACLSNVLAVGATETDDGRCRAFTWGGGSNWGKHIAVVAPGNRIYGLDFKDNNNYEVYWSGTSQATAYVTGLASLLISQDPSRTNKDLREIITATAKDGVGDPREDAPGWDEYYGYGRIDMYAALNYGNQVHHNDKTKDRDNDNSGVRDNNDDPGNKQAKALDPNSSNGNDDDKRAHKVGR